jgi:hypothetical protein
LSALRTVRAVAWSFLGIRQKAGYDSDVQQLKPVPVVITGLVAAALFVLGLVILVRWVVSSGAAA